MTSVHHSQEIDMSTKCKEKTEVYSRVCGFFRPVQQWNKGKKEEFRERKEFTVSAERE
ncbi:MAG: anaerobic ribonucleoside-triphosphate reductase [Desulfuromonadales bacterium]|nr:anaerobic ribonucleoside-triphosphate reductase [Desulfuromonadales bacterium]MDT8423748.1 anaerobic ribonucleoside-triphosphate reductase [Desulfuromonadales bacterium]